VSEPVVVVMMEAFELKTDGVSLDVDAALMPFLSFLVDGVLACAHGLGSTTRRSRTMWWLVRRHRGATLLILALKPIALASAYWERRAHHTKRHDAFVRRPPLPFYSSMPPPSA